MTGPGIHGNDPRREPLDPVERELAERLARLGPHGEPPPAIDARILAAAHAATTAAPRRNRRLPLAVGVAASLVLALGLAWQLRPLLDDPPPPVESERMDVAAPADGSPAAAPASAPVGAGSAAGGDAAEDRSTAREAGPERKAAAATDAAEAPPRSARGAPRPQAFPAPAAPSPSPPAPPPAPTATAPVAPTAAPTAPAPIAETGAAEAEDARLRRQSTASQRSFDQGHDAATQAMQESAAATGEAGSRDAEAQLRQAQFARIRALRDAGHTAQARDELEAFLERWPGYPVPDDLQALLR